MLVYDPWSGSEEFIENSFSVGALRDPRLLRNMAISGRIALPDLPCSSPTSVPAGVGATTVFDRFAVGKGLVQRRPSLTPSDPFDTILDVRSIY